MIASNDNHPTLRRSPAWWAANLVSLPVLIALVWLVAHLVGFA